jgi:hypothetical protein
LVRLYPRSWRALHEDELVDILEQEPPSMSLALDVVRGALDAHLHRDGPIAWPAYAAVLGGSVWVVLGVLTASELAPPDWPGYTLDLVPLAILAAASLLLAVGGLWLRVGDGASTGATFAMVLAIVGHAAWLVALLATAAGVDYTAAVVLATTVAILGNLLVAASIFRAGARTSAAVLAGCSLALLAPVATEVPVALSWLVYGLGWSAIGLLELHDIGRRLVPTTIPVT